MRRPLCSEWGWTRACCVTWRGLWGQRRCPLLLGTWGLTRRGLRSKGKCGKAPVLVSVPELTVLSPSWDSGHRGLSVPHGGLHNSIFSTFSINLCRMPEKKPGRGEKKRQEWLSQVSYSELVLSLSFLKCPSLDLLIVSDSGVSCLSPVHAHSLGAFSEGLLSPLRSRLPMTWWPGPCEEAPLGTVPCRASHPRVGNGVSVLLGSKFA